MKQQTKEEKEKKDLTMNEALISVRKTLFNQETTDQEYIRIRPFITDVCRINVELSRTINLGNYESAKVSVGINMPCYVEEAIDVYHRVLSKAEELITVEVKKICKTENVTADVEELI